MTNGEVLRVSAAMKPISTVPRALATLDVVTGEEAVAIHQRSDVCAVPAAGVVAEAMVALVVADAVVEKFGGDSIAETRRNVEGYLATIARHAAPARLERRTRADMTSDPAGSVRPSCWSARRDRASPASVAPSPGSPGCPCGTPTPTSRRSSGRSIPDIFANDGEDAFRALERAAVAAALAEHAGVLALGGGADPRPRDPGSAGRTPRGVPGGDHADRGAPHRAGREPAAAGRR